MSTNNNDSRPLFSTPLHGNQFYFHVKKFVRFFTLFFQTVKKDGKKKLQWNTNIVDKEATKSKHLHLYIPTISKNNVSSLLMM